MKPDDTQQANNVQEMFATIRRKLRRLTVAVYLLALMTAILAAVVYGVLLNYFAGDMMLQSAALIAAAVVGFVVGLVAHRRA